MSTTASVVNSQKSVRKTGSRRKDNIRQRGASWQVRLLHDGESLTRTFATKGDAQDWLDLKRGEQLPGDLRAFHKAQHLTLRAAILQYRDHLINKPGDGAEQQELSRLKCLAELSAPTWVHGLV